MNNTLLKFEDLMAMIKNHSTEAELHNYLTDYYRIDNSDSDKDDLFVIGFFLVEVQEGIAVLPYDQINPDDGYEQISLERCGVINPDDEVFAYFKEKTLDHLKWAKDAAELLLRSERLNNNVRSTNTPTYLPQGE